MHKKDVIEVLEKAFAYFRLAPGFLAALTELIAESGNELAILKLLMIRLLVLQSLGVEATQQKEFETLTGSGLFSMHLAGRGFNIRILYGFLPDRKPVLLLPFYERGGKSATDYSGKISVAQKLLDELKEEYENGKF